MKKIVILLVATLLLSVIAAAGCTSNNQQPVQISTNTTSTMTATATTIPSATPTITPTPTATPATTLTISGPTTIAEGQGGTWTVYINGQLPSSQQASQIQWSGAPSGMMNPPRPIGPLGSWTIDSNGAANVFPGTYTLTATYQGMSASYTITRLANPTATPYPTLVNPDINHDTRQWVSTPTPLPPAPEPKK